MTPTKATQKMDPDGAFICAGVSATDHLRPVIYYQGTAEQIRALREHLLDALVIFDEQETGERRRPDRPED